MVGLHGYGDEPSSLQTALGDLLPSIAGAIVAPRGPTVTPAGPAWFPSDAADEGPPLGEALDLLRAEVLTECAALGFGTDEITVLGWSQGAAAAMAMTLSAGVTWRPRNVIGLAAWLPNEPDVAWDFAAAASAGVRVLLVHGTGDEVVPMAQGRGAQRVLERHGVEVSLIEVDTGHDLVQLLPAAASWLTDATG